MPRYQCVCLLNTYMERASRGSALLIVLWVIAFLSFLMVTTMMVAMQDVETVASRQLVFRARQLAEIGLNIGAHPTVKAGDPLLRRNYSGAESYEASITTEEGRLNINALLTEERRGVLERLFESWGLKSAEAQAVVDCLMDWVDADDFKRLKGAERQDYKKDGVAGRPYNRPFRSLDEMLLVRGMEQVAEANPKWRDVFTLWGAGKLDINEAEPELIAIAADVPLSATQPLISTRNGPDGILHTADDEPLQSLEAAMTLLGVKSPESAAKFTLHGLTQRVDSLGRVGNFARRISVVLQKNAGSMAVMEWRESAER